MMASIQQAGAGGGGQPTAGGPTARTTQSEQSLSRSSGEADDDGRFEIAEEVNLDQQGDKARQVGQMPRDADAAVGASEAMAESMRQDKPRRPHDGRA
jgi:hypothetical protein